MLAYNKPQCLSFRLFENLEIGSAADKSPKGSKGASGEKSPVLFSSFSSKPFQDSFVMSLLYNIVESCVAIL